MTQHDDPLIQGMPLSWWEGWMDDMDRRAAVGRLRGVRAERVYGGGHMARTECLSDDEWLGIHHSGPRMGTRITMVDLGWSAEGE